MALQCTVCTHGTMYMGCQGSKDFALLAGDVPIALRTNRSECNESALLPLQSRHADKRNVQWPCDFLVEPIAAGVLRRNEVSIGEDPKHGCFLGGFDARIDGRGCWK